MPGLKHQSIVQILRDEPQLLVMFLGRSGFQLPSGAFPIIADSDLSHRTPRMLKELRSDNVFLFQGMHEKVAVVVEVQTSRPNHKRKLTWPCYVTSAREVHDCKAYLLVVAAGRDALTGSESVIEIGQPGFDLLPFVTGRDRMPAPGGRFFGPELTMLHILTGTLDLSIHEARMFALASIARGETRPVPPLRPPHPHLHPATRTTKNWSSSWKTSSRTRSSTASSRRASSSGSSGACNRACNRA